MKKWDDQTKFTFETWRTVGMAIAGIIVVALIVDPWKHSQTYRAEIDKTKLTLGNQAAGNFAAASYTYTSIMAAALRPDVTDQDRKSYEDDAYDRYRLALHAVKVHFSGEAKDRPKMVAELTSALNRADELNEKLHNVYTANKIIAGADNLRHKLCSKEEGSTIGLVDIEKWALDRKTKYVVSKLPKPDRNQTRSREEWITNLKQMIAEQQRELWANAGVERDDLKKANFDISTQAYALARSPTPRSYRFWLAVLILVVSVPATIVYLRNRPTDASEMTAPSSDALVLLGLGWPMLAPGTDHHAGTDHTNVEPGIAPPDEDSTSTA